LFGCKLGWFVTKALLNQFSVSIGLLVRTTVELLLAEKVRLKKLVFTLDLLVVFLHSFEALDEYLNRIGI
jgi:hypothetical protein